MLLNVVYSEQYNSINNRLRFSLHFYSLISLPKIIVVVVEFKILNGS